MEGPLQGPNAICRAPARGPRRAATRPDQTASACRKTIARRRRWRRRRWMVVETRQPWSGGARRSTRPHRAALRGALARLGAALLQLTAELHNLAALYGECLESGTECDGYFLRGGRRRLGRLWRLWLFCFRRRRRMRVLIFAGAAVVATRAALVSGAVVEVRRAAAWVKGAPSGGNRTGPWPIYCGRCIVCFNFVASAESRAASWPEQQARRNYTLYGRSRGSRERSHRPLAPPRYALRL